MSYFSLLVHFFKVQLAIEWLLFLDSISFFEKCVTNNLQGAPICFILSFITFNNR